MLHQQRSLWSQRAVREMASGTLRIRVCGLRRRKPPPTHMTTDRVAYMFQGCPSAKIFQHSPERIGSGTWPEQALKLCNEVRNSENIAPPLVPERPFGNTGCPPRVRSGQLEPDFECMFGWCHLMGGDAGRTPPSQMSYGSG